VVSVEHRGANNLSGGMEHLAQRHDLENGTEFGTYCNQFTCIPRKLPIRPQFIPKPTISGPEVGIVVGMEGAQWTSDRNHRIKVQFPWLRGAVPALGQTDHPQRSNAPGDEKASAWVRMLQPVAGPNWGANFTPRIGNELVIEFINGDADRLIAISSLYSPVNQPDLHGGDNHTGALSGFSTLEENGTGQNKFHIDDTPNQLRQMLSSSTQATQLNTGYLIHQNGNQRRQYRGSGAELRTDGWTVTESKGRHVAHHRHP